MIIRREFVVRFIRLGIDLRLQQRRSWKEEDKLKKERADREKEELLIKNGLRGETDIDYNFQEEHFDSALEKLVEMAHRFDSRQAGPDFRRIFEVSFFTPGEFKEVLKRTFKIRTSAQELGVFVSYFDLSMSGIVSTTAFISSFMKMRITIDEFKGKSNEKELLKEYQDRLKVSYKGRIERMTSVTNDSSLKPWRTHGMVSLFDRKQHKPYPKSAAHKLRRRLNIGLKTGKLDLSTQCLWDTLEADEVTEDPLIESFPTADEGVTEAPGDEAALAVSIRDEFRQLSKKSGAIDLTEKNKSRLKQKQIEDLEMLSAFISYSKTEKKVSVDRIIRNLVETPNSKIKDIEAVTEKDRVVTTAINFRLGAIPTEVFNMLLLRELWLCNNEMKFIPSQIGELKMLELLSLVGNDLESISPEICLIESLKSLHLQHNNLKVLPDLFGRLRNLSYCNLSSNDFEIFPEILCSLSNLVTLEAESNTISSLPESLKNMRSLTRLNLANNEVVTPEAVLSKMWWVNVVPGCAVMENPKGASIFKITNEESLRFTSFLKSKALSRVNKAREEREIKLATGIAPGDKVKMKRPKIILK